MQRCVDGGPCRLLAGWQAVEDLVERERVVAELDVLEPCERRAGRFGVALDRRRLAVARRTVVLDCDLDDVGLVLGAARDRERLGELHGHLLSRQFHGG